MKKKLFSIVLALALCVGLTVPVSAKLADDYEIFSIIGDEYVINADGNSQGGSVQTAHDGLRDKAGNTVIPAEYIDLKFIDGADALIARKHMEGRRYADGIIDINQDILVPFQYSMIRPMWWETDSGYLDIEDSKTFLRGIMGPDFSIVVPTQYFYVKLLSKEDGYFAVTDTFNDKAAWNAFGSNGEWRNDRDGKWGVYSATEGLIIPCKYDQIEYLGDNYFSVRQNEVVGVVNSRDEVVLPLKYARYQNPLYNGIFRSGNIFIVSKYTSDGYCQRVAAGEGMPDVGELWTTDGVVDINNNILIDFGKYQTIGFNSQTGIFTCGRWTGEYKPQKYQVVGGATAYENKYEYEYIRYDSLNVSESASEKPSTAPDGSSLVITTPGGTITIPVPDTKPSEQTPSTSNNSSAFTDVKSSDYYADAVQWAVEKNITSGTSKTTFSPGTTCTNAQILAFLYRANGSPEPTTANPFTDIKTSDYYYKAALWAAEKGMVSGSTFGANTPCTRAATVKYIWKAAGSPAASYDGKFNDVSASADYAQAVSWAVENKVTSGTSKTTFSPDSICTRGQIVAFLYRAFGK